MPRLRPAPEPTAKKPPVDPKEQKELQLEGTEPEGEGEEEIIVVEQQEKPNEAELALMKQIEDLKKSEEFQRNQAEQFRREREEALRREREGATKLEQFQKDMQEQEEVAVGSALAAAKAEAEKALLDFKNALDAGDTAAQAEAMDKLTTAKANVQVLERGKDEIEQRKKAPVVKIEERPRAPTTAAELIDTYQLPDDCKIWLKNHQQYVTDQLEAARLNVIHIQLLRRGLQPGHPQYLSEIEKGLKASEPPGTDEGDEPQPQTRERASIMSAPVSREAPSSSGKRTTTKVTLTPEQKEFAKIAGVTEVEYAKQLQKLDEAKQVGNYGERRYG